MKHSALLVLILICATACAQDSAMFRGDPLHSGVYTSPAVGAPGKIKWRFQTKGHVLSSPAVAGDLVYVGSNDHHLYAIDRESGAEKWKFKTESRVTSSPAVAGGLVYFGSFDGAFYAVDATTGQQKWKFETAGERRYSGTRLHGLQPAGESMPDPWDFYLSSPVIGQGLVYFGSGDGYVYALDARTGAMKWRFRTGDVVHASPALANGLLYVGSWDTYFYALDAVTGKEKWRFKTGEDPQFHNQVGIPSSPTVVDGMVYFGCRDSNVYALDAATGQKKWAFSNHGSWVIASPVVQAGKLYFVTSDTGLMQALDAKSGAPLYSLNFQKWPLFSSPTIAGSMLYVGSFNGKLLAVDLDAHKTAWEFQTEASKHNLPLLVKPDGSPNFEALFGDLFYDDMLIGVQKLLATGAILSSPVVSRGVIYVGSADGSLYAIH